MLEFWCQNAAQLVQVHQIWVAFMSGSFVLLRGLLIRRANLGYVCDLGDSCICMICLDKSSIGLRPNVHLIVLFNIVLVQVVVVLEVRNETRFGLPDIVGFGSRVEQHHCG